MFQVQLDSDTNRDQQQGALPATSTEEMELLVTVYLHLKAQSRHSESKKSEQERLYEFIKHLTGSWRSLETLKATLHAWKITNPVEWEAMQGAAEEDLAHGDTGDIEPQEAAPPTATGNGVDAGREIGDEYPDTEETLTETGSSPVLGKPQPPPPGQPAMPGPPPMEIGDSVTNVKEVSICP